MRCSGGAKIAPLPFFVLLAFCLPDWQTNKKRECARKLGFFLVSSSVSLSLWVQRLAPLWCKDCTPRCKDCTPQSLHPCKVCTPQSLHPCKVCTPSLHRGDGFSVSKC